MHVKRYYHVLPYFLYLYLFLKRHFFFQPLLWPWCERHLPRIWVLFPLPPLQPSVKCRLEPLLQHRVMRLRGLAKRQFLIFHPGSLNFHLCWTIPLTPILAEQLHRVQGLPPLITHFCSNQKCWNLQAYLGSAYCSTKALDGSLHLHQHHRLRAHPCLGRLAQNLHPHWRRQSKWD